MNASFNVLPSCLCIKKFLQGLIGIDGYFAHFEPSPLHFYRSEFRG